MNYKNDSGITSFIQSLFFFGSIIFLVLYTVFGIFAPITLRIFFGITHPNVVLKLGAGISFIIVIVGFLWIAVLQCQRQAQWRHCEHGVPGGTAQNLCQICEEEKIARENIYQKNIQNKENQKNIDNQYNALREAEAKRLSNYVLPNLEELRQLTPHRFEDEIASMFRRLGYIVEQTPYSNDYGRDAIMERNGDKYILECKKYGPNNIVGRPDLQKFHSAIMSDKAKKGFFVNTGIFSRGAIKFATNTPIELIDGQQLLRLMTDSKPTGSSDDSYHSVCRQCGSIVQHRLRIQEDAICPDGHLVPSTLRLDEVLAAAPGAVPTCRNCGAMMRLVTGRNGKFWGCSRYPACHATKRFGVSPARRTLTYESNSGTAAKNLNPR